MATFDRDQNAWFDEMGLRTEAPQQETAQPKSPSAADAIVNAMRNDPRVLQQAAQELGVSTEELAQKILSSNDPNALISQLPHMGAEALKSLGGYQPNPEVMAQQQRQTEAFANQLAVENKGMGLDNPLSLKSGIPQKAASIFGAPVFNELFGTGSLFAGETAAYGTGAGTQQALGNGPMFDFNAAGNSPVSNLQLAGDIPGAGGTGLTGDGTIAAGLDPLTTGQTITAPFDSTMSTAELDALVNGTGDGVTALPAGGMTATGTPEVPWTDPNAAATGGVAGAQAATGLGGIVGPAGTVLGTAAGLGALTSSGLGTGATDWTSSYFGPGGPGYIPTNSIMGPNPPLGTIDPRLQGPPNDGGPGGPDDKPPGSDAPGKPFDPNSFDWAGKLGGLDWTKILGGALPGLLGAYGANSMADAYKTQSDKYLALGAPYRTRADAALTQGFNGDIPGLTPGLNYAAKAMTNAANVNPAGSPATMQRIQDELYAKNYAPAYQNYVNSNLAGGGLAALQSAGVQNANDSIQGTGAVFKNLGDSAGNIFGTKPTSMQDIFKQLFGGK